MRQWYHGRAGLADIYVMQQQGLQLNVTAHVGQQDGTFGFVPLQVHAAAGAQPNVIT